MNKILLIALNEFKLKTSRIKKNRGLILSIIFSILLFWAIFLGPNLFELILPEILKQYQMAFRSTIISVIEYSLMLTFLLYMLYPLYVLYQKEEIGMKEFLLAAPVEPGKIFLGRILGEMPLYFLLVLGVGPMGTSLLLQINPNMGLIQIFLIYVFFWLLMFFGLLIGSLIAHWLEIRMLFSPKLSKYKNLIPVIIAAVVVAFFYFFHFFFRIFVFFPEIKNWFLFYPALWYSNVILYLVDPQLISGYIFNLWFYLFLIIISNSIFFYYSYKKANQFFMLSISSSEEFETKGKNSRFSILMEKISPANWSTLIKTESKRIFRKVEFRIKLIYSALLLGVIGIIIFFSANDLQNIWSELNMNNEFELNLHNMTLSLMIILAWTGGFIYGLLIGSSEIIESKELLFLFRRTPKGFNSLVISFLFLNLYIILILDTILAFFFLFLFQLSILEFFTFFSLFFGFNMIFLIQSMGIQFLNPLFMNKRKGLFFNVYTFFGVHIIAFIIAIYVSTPNFSFSSGLFVGFNIIVLSYLIIEIMLSIIICLAGIKRMLNFE